MDLVHAVDDRHAVLTSRGSPAVSHEHSKEY